MTVRINTTPQPRPPVLCRSYSLRSSPLDLSACEPATRPSSDTRTTTARQNHSQPLSMAHPQTSGVTVGRDRRANRRKYWRPHPDSNRGRRREKTVEHQAFSGLSAELLGFSFATVALVRAEWTGLG